MHRDAEQKDLTQGGVEEHPPEAWQVDSAIAV